MVKSRRRAAVARSRSGIALDREAAVAGAGLRLAPRQADVDRPVAQLEHGEGLADAIQPVRRAQHRLEPVRGQMVHLEVGLVDDLAEQRVAHAAALQPGAAAGLAHAEADVAHDVRHRVVLPADGHSSRGLSGWTVSPTFGLCQCRENGTGGQPAPGGRRGSQPRPDRHPGRHRRGGRHHLRLRRRGRRRGHGAGAAGALPAPGAWPTPWWCRRRWAPRSPSAPAARPRRRCATTATAACSGGWCRRSSPRRWSSRRPAAGSPRRSRAAGCRSSWASRWSTPRSTSS